VAALLVAANLSAAAESSLVRDANAGWRFLRGEQPGAEAPGFDDSAWRVLDLPHDWSIEPARESDAAKGPHDPATPEGPSVGYLRGGIGWYRLHLDSETVGAGEELELVLHGAQQECDIWVNGHHVAFQPHGYIPRVVEIAQHLQRGSRENVIAIRVLNPEANTRWYAGSGLFRGVSLRPHAPLYIPTWGVRADTVWLNEGNAQVQLQIEVRNNLATPQDVAIEAELISPRGERTRHDLGMLRLGPATTECVNQTIAVSAAAPWSPETPQLYRVNVRLFQGERTFDRAQTAFGIRTIAVDAKAGLRLNGRPIKLFGACLHHDNGLLGAAAFPDAERRRVRLMKANGFNAIRTSHNPPSTAFLEACDEEGILVIDEFADTWELPKKPNGYQRYFAAHWESDLRAMLARDFNHPSVIMWSIGNEIAERFNPRGIEIGRKLAAFVRSRDARRPVTNAINSPWENANLATSWEGNDPAFTFLDVGGYNYAWERYESDHTRMPQRVIAGTESFPRDALENWRLIEAQPYIIGDFVWTGMDHLGESAIGHTAYIDSNADPKTTGLKDWEPLPWPFWVNWSGDLDLIGNKKPQSLYRDVVWRRSPLEILVHEPVPAGKKEKVGAWGWPAELPTWNWPGHEQKPLEVTVYSRAGLVRLELNGRTIGEQSIDQAKSITAKFTVPWEPGVITAKAIENGTVVAVKELRTTGAAKRLRATAETVRAPAARSSLVFVPIEILDETGAVVPNAAVDLTATVEGEAELKAFGSANPEDPQSFLDNRATSFRGRALAILRSTGKPGKAQIRLSASGLEPISLSVDFAP
jgi:beta-galactosidase